MRDQPPGRGAGLVVRGGGHEHKDLRSRPWPGTPGLTRGVSHDPGKEGRTPPRRYDTLSVLACFLRSATHCHGLSKFGRHQRSAAIPTASQFLAKRDPLLPHICSLTAPVLAPYRSAGGIKPCTGSIRKVFCPRTDRPIPAVTGRPCDHAIGATTSASHVRCSPLAGLRP